MRKNRTYQIAKNKWLEIYWHYGRSCWAACMTEDNRGRWIFSYTRSNLFNAVRRDLKRPIFNQISIEKWV
jgi:hypothetical protein